jgi:hypothetical protein
MRTAGETKVQLHASHACVPTCAQVKNNYIESYGPALQLGSNVFAPTPFNYPDMNSISFTGNTIVKSQFGVVIIESASSVTMSNTKFRDLMCRRAPPRSSPAAQHLRSLLCNVRHALPASCW